MAEVSVLIVTSAGAPSSTVVPVLAACEAAGLRVRAIDVGGAGGGGGGMADRVRRALLGENAERRLRKELEASPPDVAVVFDPHAALALTVARDQVQNPAPVVAVVGELEPVTAWASTDADRFVVADELCAVALADTGVEGERILVVGAVGERAFADAAASDRAALRTRFKLGGKLALVEVAGMGAEATASLALQLSLLDGSDCFTFLFDAAGDVDAAAVLRRQVPALGLKAKLFGATGDQATLWRVADVVIARPRPEVVARVMLVGAKLVALVDDTLAGSARAALALESRKRGVTAKGLLLLASALESAVGGTPPPATPDGADNIADIVAAVAGDKRGVIDERRAAAQAATRDKVRAASAATQAAAATTAMPGELEDLGGDGGLDDVLSDPPDRAEFERLRGEVAKRVAELTRAMNLARDAGYKYAAEAKTATAQGKPDEATKLAKQGDAEHARMHAMLAELATLETELRELERAQKAVADRPRAAPPPSRPTASDLDDLGEPSPPPRRGPTVDDALAELKRKAGGGSGPPPKPTAGTKPSPPPRGGSTVDDALAELKRKMAGAPKKP